MKLTKKTDPLIRLVSLIPVILIAGFAHANEALLERGEYVFRMAGGCGCHQDPNADTNGDDGILGGGRPIKTPFGTFYSTNITPNKEHGIGTWTREDFLAAMTQGRHKDGYDLYPVFPYPSYAKMKRSDLKAMWEYVKTLEPSSRANRPHDLAFPFSMRLSNKVWKWLFLDNTPWKNHKGQTAKWNRGAYLVQTAGHCSECHTPRNLMGALEVSRYLAGTAEGQGPEGSTAPNLTPHPEGLGEWAPVDISYYLKTGMTPDGDFAAGLMSELIDDGYSHLTDKDRAAIAAYLATVEVQSPPGDTR